MQLVLILILITGEGEVYKRNIGDTMESCTRDGEHIIAEDPEKYSGYVCLYDSRTQPNPVEG